MFLVPENVCELLLLSMQYLLDLKEGKWSYIEGKGEKPSPRTGQTATLLDDGRVLVFGGSSMTDGLVISLIHVYISSAY